MDDVNLVDNLFFTDCFISVVYLLTSHAALDDECRTDKMKKKKKMTSQQVRSLKAALLLCAVVPNWSPEIPQHRTVTWQRRLCQRGHQILLHPD